MCKDKSIKEKLLLHLPFSLTAVNRGPKIKEDDG